MATLVSRTEFARICGVNRSTVTRWIQNGGIAVAQGSLIDVDAALRMREVTESPLPHHQARKAQFIEAREAKGMPEAKKFNPSAADQAQCKKTSSETTAISAEFKLETWKLQKAKAELAALEVDKINSSLVELAEVEAALTEVGSALRVILEGMPNRLAGQLAAHRADATRIREDLQAAATELFSGITDLIFRKYRNTLASK